MAFDKQLAAEKLRRWETYLREYRLPSWEYIPNLGLYMEQVTDLMKQYLDYLPPELKEEQFITAATVNNYVRMKIMPEPRKKRYYRTHLAYLIIILTLKQSLSITMIKSLLPLDMTEAELETRYRTYADRHRQVSEYFVEQVRADAAPLLGRQSDSPLATDDPEALIVTSAMMGGLNRLLAEKLLLLDGRTPEPPTEAVPPAESVHPALPESGEEAVPALPVPEEQVKKEMI